MSEPSDTRVGHSTLSCSSSPLGVYSQAPPKLCEEKMSSAPPESTNMASLTAHEVEQLVSLRLAVEDARLQARRAGTYRRGAAIVALDAAVERASALVAFTRGIPVTSTTKLDDLISRLKESLGPTWTPTVLPDIRHLRRARNAAQHEGLEPDRDQIPRWASAAEAYVATLIDAQFSTDILRVVLADAVNDEILREGIRRAETARDAGEYVKCVDLAREVYSDALGRWKKLRHRQGLPSPRSLRARGLGQSADSDVKPQLEGLQRTIDAAAFASDLADAEWFTAAISEQGNWFDAEDAERATSFAFEWVTGFERAAATWTPNRRHRSNVAARLVRSDEGPARVDGLLSTGLRLGYVRSILRIADVPNEDGRYQAWARALGVILGRDGGIGRWSVRDDGTVALEVTTAESDDVDSHVRWLASALIDAETSVRDQRTKAMTDEKATRERKLAAQSALHSIAEEIPGWIDTIEWADDRRGEEGRWEVTLASGAMGLLSRRQIDGADVTNQDVASMIREHDTVKECYLIGGRGTLGITPVLNPADLLSVLRSVDAKAQVILHEDERAVREEDETLARVKRAVALALIDLT